MKKARTKKAIDKKAAAKKARTQKASATKKATTKKPTAKRASATKKASAKRSSADDGGAAREIDAKIEGLGDWRGQTLAHVRALIKRADPEVIEEIKWRKPTNPGGVPVWSHGGILCTGETYSGKVKLTFAKGASLPDPGRLFNASLVGNARRAIDLREGDEVDGGDFVALIQAAVALNQA